MDLIDELRHRQGEKTQMEFATELGIGQSYLSELYRREKNLGIDVARKIIQRFPDLKAEVVAYLLAEEDQGTNSSRVIASS